MKKLNVIYYTTYIYYIILTPINIILHKKIDENKLYPIFPMFQIQKKQTIQANDMGRVQ